MNYSALPSLVNPEALTYFLVNSGVFLAVAAGVFFVIGVTFGRLIWGRDRAKLRKADAAIENFKDEVAGLKRRIAEGVSLPGRHFGPSLPLALSTPTSLKGPFYPVSRMFYTWGEGSWQPPNIRPQPQHGSQAFTLWTHSEYDQPIGALFTASQAFTVWTEPLWTPQPVRRAPLPPSQAFGLWTEPDVVLHPRALISPNAAFTLWTLPDWKSIPPRLQPIGASSAFTIWTMPDFTPIKRILFSQSQAMTLWTEAGWSPPQRSEPLPQSQAFTIWAPPVMAPVIVEEAPPPPAPVEAVENPSLRGSVFSRAMNVARGALRRNRPDEVAASAPVELPVSVVPTTPPPPAIVPWDSPPELIQRWHRLPPSQAFTLWTQPSWEPFARITVGAYHGSPIAAVTGPLITEGASRSVLRAIAARVPEKMENEEKGVAGEPLPKAPVHREPAQGVSERAQISPSDMPSNGNKAPVAAEAVAAEPVSAIDPPSHGETSVLPEVEPAEAKEEVVAPEPVSVIEPPSHVEAPTLPRAVAPAEVKEEVVPPEPLSVIEHPPHVETPVMPTAQAIFEAGKPQVHDEAAPINHAFVTADLPAHALQDFLTESSPPVLEPIAPLSAPPEEPAKAESKPLTAVPAPRIAERVIPSEPPRPNALSPVPSRGSEANRVESPEIAPFPFLSVDPEALPDLHHAPHWHPHEVSEGAMRQDGRLGMVYDTRPENADDLTAVSGISADRAHRLNDWGIYSFKQIALWGDAQIREFALRLGMKERFIREHWIEQARGLHFHRHRERI